MLSASLLIGEFDLGLDLFRKVKCGFPRGHLLLTLPPWLPDGELYSGTSADFMGRDFAIFRTLGDHHPIRTEQHDSRWLNGNKKR